MKLKSNLRFSLAFPLAAAIAALLTAPFAHAANVTWDITPGTVGAGDSAVTGGIGTWDTSTGNWTTDGGVNNIAWVNANLDTAVLGGTAGAITLGSNVSVGGLRLNTTGYGITTTGFALNFDAADNTILFNNIAAASITDQIGGTGNLILKASVPNTSGTLNLNGTSTGGWSGTTTLGTGTTVALAGSNQALLNTSGITLNGAGIRLTNTNTAEAALDRVGSSAITSNGGTLTFTNTSGADTYAETIGSVALTSGQLNLVETTDQVGAGSQTLTLGGLTHSGASNTSAVTFAALTTSPNATKNIIAVTGATQTTAGQIIAPWATTGVATGSQNLFAVYNAAGQIVPMTVADTAESTWTVATDTYSGIGGITLTGTRTINALRYYGGASTFALGNFNLETYGLLFGGNNAMTVSSVATTGVLTTPTGGGSLYITSGFSAPAHVISAPINDNGGAVTVVKSGAGSLTLSSTTSNYSGGTVINAGTLTAALDTNLGAAGAANGITFNGSANFAQGGVTYLRNIIINNGAIAHFTGNNNPTFSGNVTGTGGVQLSNGFGTQINFTGTANTFEGPVLLAGAGTTGQAYLMQFSSFVDSATANGRIRFLASSVTHANGSVFQYNGSTNLTLANRQIEIASTGATPTNGHQIRSSGAGTLSISSDLIVTSTTAQRLSLGGTNTGANNFTSNISNGSSSALGLTKANNGNWNLSGTNTYTGTTVMGFSNPSGGNLTFQGIQALSPSTTLSQTHAGGVGGFGTFKILDDAVTPALRTGTNISMASSNTSNGLVLFIGNNNAANGGTSAGATTGSTIALGNLTMTQTVVGNTSQTLNVTGANSYRIQINNVNLPSLAGNFSGVLSPTSAPLTVAGNIQQVAGSTAGALTLSLDGTNAGNQVTGNILNSLDITPRALSLTKTNSGTWTLSGTNSFSGGLTLSGASANSRLNINSATALGTGTFTINGGNNARFDNTTASPITLTANNPQNWSNDFVFIGTRDLNMGTGAVSMGGTRGITVTASTLTVGGAISGIGFGLTKAGSGTLSLGGTNAYTGATTVSGGTLTLDVDDCLSDSSNVVIGNGTLSAAAAVNDTVGTLSVTNAASTINLGAGATLAFATGSPAWTGTLNITGTFVSGSSLRFGIDNTGLSVTQLGQITGVGAVALNGSGFLVTAGGNTYADWLVLNPPATGFVTDSDNDGLSNGVENVLGSNPNTYNAGLTEVSSTPTSVVFKHTLNPSVASDVTYSYQWSTDMVEWKASTETNTGGTTATIVPSGPVLGVVTVTITITGGPSAKLFGRLVAVK